MDHVIHRANTSIDEHRAQVDQLTAWIDGIDEDKQQGLREKLDAERAVHLSKIDTLNQIKFAMNLLSTEYAYLMDAPSAPAPRAAAPAAAAAATRSAAPAAAPAAAAAATSSTHAASAQCVKCGLTRERKHFSEEAWRSRTPICEAHDAFRDAKKARRA